MIIVPRASLTRRAFTLIEVLVASAIGAVLMTAVAAALFLAARALPDGTGPDEPVFAATTLSEQIADELFTAVAILHRKPHEIAFAVADRNNDGDWELIRYTWSGTPGDPVLRTFNENAAEVVLADVAEFALDYLGSKESDPPAGGESGELLLWHDDVGTTRADSTYAVTATKWVGAHLQLSFGPEVTAWRITRVAFMPRGVSTADGQLAVEVRPSDLSYAPGATLIDTAYAKEPEFAADSWHEVSFSNAGNLTPNGIYCLVFRYAAGTGTIGQLRYCTGSTATPPSRMISTTTSGASWSHSSSEDLWLQVWGRVTSGAPPTGTRSWLRQVGLGVRVGGNVGDRVSTRVRLLNEPEVTGL